ncbi:DUF3108 domain-containing protein [Chondrinema litorale]|uniref:DUF3108 domain-containing protein n=1 Tax=Chondrinema litorale TaxID=2994555 RepID=UPI0025439B9B|nr:DUF3108 domain-containing protein [Chondrinema litorale]UZR95192.1 DUF3108 domain-containing protein [Chondrinema litorale]
MRKYIFYIVAVLLSSSFIVKDGHQYRQIKNNSFARGERFVYEAHYLGFNGGEGVITLDEDIHKVNGRDCYKVDVHGKTTGMASWFYQVEDLWRSYIDTGAITSQKFFRDINEGKSYKLKETTLFDHKNKKGKLKQDKKGKVKVKEFKLKDYPQDMISGYYYLRTIDFDNKNPGDIINMNAVYEDTVYDFSVKYLGKEVLKTKVGKIHTFALSPIMPDNKLFDGGDAITFWVSDDRNRVPLEVKAKMFIASVRVELVDYSGLKYPFNFAED